MVLKRPYKLLFWSTLNLTKPANLFVMSFIINLWLQWSQFPIVQVLPIYQTTQVKAFQEERKLGKRR